MQIWTRMTTASQVWETWNLHWLVLSSVKKANYHNYLNTLQKHQKKHSRRQLRSDGLRLPIIFQRSSLWVEVAVFWFSGVLTVWWLSHAPFMDPFQNATFDPWSGKSLGEVEKPQGFDDYWKDQEACSFFKRVNRSLSIFMHLYLWERWLRLHSLFCREALLLEAVQRGEKEPEELDPVGEKKGKGRGKGGKGFRRSRYNVVPKPPPRARPTHFVAIRLFSRMNFELHFRRIVDSVCKCCCCSIRWWLLFPGLFVPSFELSTCCFRFFITFLCFLLYVQSRIRRNVHQMQQWFIAKNPLFEHCLVPVRLGKVFKKYGKSMETW